MSFTFDPIEDIIAELKQGKMVIVTDDENRENEGDLIAAASLCTPETINFMAKHARGLICAAITEERAAELKLNVPINMADPFRYTEYSGRVPEGVWRIANYSFTRPSFPG